MNTEATHDMEKIVKEEEQEQSNMKEQQVEDAEEEESLLAKIYRTFVDDVHLNVNVHDYLRFIPLCVKSLHALNQMETFHEAFFARATRNIELFIAHFLRLYDVWRRRQQQQQHSGSSSNSNNIANAFHYGNTETSTSSSSLYSTLADGSSTNLNSNSNSTTVYTLRIRAFELMDDVTSLDEAIATLQSHELHALLNALFTELEKILRNAFYLHNIICVAQFPFLSEFLLQPVSLDVNATSSQWRIDHTRLIAHSLHSLSSESITRLRLLPQKLMEMLKQYESASRAEVNRFVLVSQQQENEQKEVINNNDNSKENDNKDSSEKEASLESYRSTVSFLTSLHNAFDLQGMIDRAVQSADIHNAENNNNNNQKAKINVTNVENTQKYEAPLTLSSMYKYLNEAITKAQRENSTVQSRVVSEVQRLTQETMNAFVRSLLISDVQTFMQYWDLQVFWSQLNYHVEFIFHVLCDAKDVEVEWDDLVTLAPFLREQRITSRLQRNALFTRNINSSSNNNNYYSSNTSSSALVDYNYSLDKLLSSFVSSTGLLKMMEETGTISFSIAAAARKAQSDVHGSKRNETRPFTTMMEDVALPNFTSNRYNKNNKKRLLASNGPAPLVLVQASQLRS